jgi:hypothetical protein
MSISQLHSRKNSLNQTIKDTFNYTKIKKEDIFKERKIFEKNLYNNKTKEAVINWMINDNSFCEITVSFVPTIRTLLNDSYNNFMSFNYEKALETIMDIHNLNTAPIDTADSALSEKINDFERIVQEVLNNHNGQDYTKRIL